jgi:hypothetical protein
VRRPGLPSDDHVVHDLVDLVGIAALRLVVGVVKALLEDLQRADVIAVQVVQVVLKKLPETFNFTVSPTSISTVLPEAAVELAADAETGAVSDSTIVRARSKLSKRLILGFMLFPPFICIRSENESDTFLQLLYHLQFIITMVNNGK